MLKDYMRLCDVCGKNVICDQYQTVKVPAGFVDVLWAGIPKVNRPTWNPNDDGSVTVELCDECVGKMGDLA